MLHASCLGTCYFLSFRGQHGWGEPWGDAGARQRCTTAPARCSAEPTAAPLLSPCSSQTLGIACWRDFRIFSLSMGVFVGQIWHWTAKLTPACRVWAPQLWHPWLLCRRMRPRDGLGSAHACTTAAPYPSSNIIIIFIIFFQALEVGKEGKLTAPKNTSCSALSREGFHIPLIPQPN